MAPLLVHQGQLDVQLVQILPPRGAQPSVGDDLVDLFKGRKEGGLGDPELGGVGQEVGLERGLDGRPLGDNLILAEAGQAVLLHPGGGDEHLGCPEMAEKLHVFRGFKGSRLMVVVAADEDELDVSAEGQVGEEVLTISNDGIGNIRGQEGAQQIDRGPGI